MPFLDPDTIRSGSTIFAGVPVGDSDGHDAFIPSVTVANFGASSVTVNLTYALSGKSIADGPPKIEEARTVTMQPKEVRLLELSGLPTSSGLTGSVVVASSGKPGDVVSSLTSFAATTGDHLSVEGHDANTIENGGKHPWVIDDSTGSDATLVMFNHSLSSQPFTVNVASRGVLWTKSYTLLSMQTMNLNLKRLIGDQTKDDRGQLLPASARSGAISWFTPKGGVGKGRLYETSSTPLKRRSFSCLGMETQCPWGAYITNPNITMNRGKVGVLGYVNVDVCQTGDPYSGSPCGDFDMGFTYNSSLITYEGCSHTSGCNGPTFANEAILTGNSVGTDNINAWVQDTANYACLAVAYGTATGTRLISTKNVGAESPRRSISSRLNCVVQILGMDGKFANAESAKREATALLSNLTSSRRS
jgi:hypothetical protein